MKQLGLGYQQFLQTGRLLHDKQSPLQTPKKGIEEMNLQELLEAEKKFLSWYPTTTSPEKELKKHLYNQYIKPRIEQLQADLRGTDLGQRNTSAI